MEVRSLLQSTKGYHNEVLIASDDQKCNLQINQEKYPPPNIQQSNASNLFIAEAHPFF
jgi:hypothetical protein